MHKTGFVPPQPAGTQKKKHMQIDCAQCYQSGSNPIKMTDNWHCIAKVSKAFHEIVRRQESWGVNESQALQPKIIPIGEKGSFSLTSKRPGGKFRAGRFCFGGQPPAFAKASAGRRMDTKALLWGYAC